MLAAALGQGDDVAPPVGRVGPAVHQVVFLQAADDAVDVVAVQPETAADVGLAEHAVLPRVARTATSERALSGMCRAVSREPSVLTLLTCQLSRSRSRAGGCSAGAASGDTRVFALVLGPVRTRGTEAGDPEQVSADQVGAVTVAASGAASVRGREIRMGTEAEFSAAPALFEVEAAA